MYSAKEVTFGLCGNAVFLQRPNPIDCENQERVVYMFPTMAVAADAITLLNKLKQWTDEAKPEPAQTQFWLLTTHVFGEDNKYKLYHTREEALEEAQRFVKNSGSRQWHQDVDVRSGKFQPLDVWKSTIHTVRVEKVDMQQPSSNDDDVLDID